MASNRDSFLDSAKDFCEWLLALRISEGERLEYAGDAARFFGEQISQRRPMTVASVLALILHILLLILTLPFWGEPMLKLAPRAFVIQQLSQPAEESGAAGRPETSAAELNVAATEVKPRLVPIPDPIPEVPEPMVKERLEVPRIVRQLALELNIGPTAAPPDNAGSGAREEGRQKGAGAEQAGPGLGSGETGPFPVGNGVSQPQVLVRTVPRYTDAAIQAKVQGVVMLRAIIRRDGRADGIQVLRGLGFGLEESAIQEILANWRFKPGVRNGQPVDVVATIEVTFNLH